MNVMKKMRKAQTMVEYIIIVCLVAVSLIAVFSYFSRSVGKKAAYAAEKIDSTEGSAAQGAIKTGGDDAIQQLK